MQLILPNQLPPTVLVDASILQQLPQQKIRRSSADWRIRSAKGKIKPKSASNGYYTRPVTTEEQTVEDGAIFFREGQNAVNTGYWLPPDNMGNVIVTDQSAFNTLTGSEFTWMKTMIVLRTTMPICLQTHSDMLVFEGIDQPFSIPTKPVDLPADIYLYPVPYDWLETDMGDISCTVYTAAELQQSFLLNQ